MKRTLVATAFGFVLGYAYAFVSCLVASKGLGRSNSKLAEQYGPEGGWMRPERYGDEDGPANNPFVKLSGEDMHDVLPTNDEFTCNAWPWP